MKSVHGGFINDLQSTHPNAAFLCRIVRTDGAWVGLTDHDSPLEFDGTTFHPAGADVVSIIRATSTMDADNADIQTAYNDGWITRRDILARLYDGARVETYLVNYSDTTKFVRLPTGIIGNVTAKDHEVVLEILGITQILKSARVGEITSAGCRAELGDTRCKIDLNRFTEHGVVIGVTGRYRFAAELVERHTSVNHQSLWEDEESTWFTKGKVIWESGLEETFSNPTDGDQFNDGLEIEIQKYEYETFGALGTVPIFNLALSMPFDIQVGDTFRVIKGCLKSRDVCVNEFGNLYNFRGEPDVPGNDKAKQYVEVS